MCRYPEKILEGMEMMQHSTKARIGYFGIKTKNAAAVEAIEKNIDDKNIELSLLGDFYPSGDEYELVYHATKRLIPPHGIPLDVGCVVNNVETFYNIRNASEGIPVTEKFICVAGAVRNPSTMWVPVGTTFDEIINFAGGTTIREYGVFVSGLLMGKLTFDLSQVVTKTCSGLIILPKEHYLIQRMNKEKQSMNRIGKSACDQCSYCTEFCPRYLLGYDVQPHKVMRSLVFTTTGKAVWNQYADLCCSCGLCSLYSCPEDLYPREACDQGKAEMHKMGIKYEQQKDVRVHPVKEGRRVPLKMLMKKLNVTHLDSKTPFNNEKPKPGSVKIMLKQHVGTPAKALVNIGDHVAKNDLIGDVEEGKLGAKIHSSIDGVVTYVSEEFIGISAN
jgi:Na+-translocating ferredoxin:NAD+ oxidoreductase RnfC subunit